MMRILLSLIICCLLCLPLLSEGLCESPVVAIAGKQKTDYTKKRVAISSRDSKSRKIPKVPPKGEQIRVIFDTDAKNEIDDVDRDRTYELLEKKLRTHAGK